MKKIHSTYGFICAIISFLGDFTIITDQVYSKEKSQILHPIGYNLATKLKSWDDLDDIDTQPLPVKLCRVADPECEACQ